MCSSYGKRLLFFAMLGTCTANGQTVYRVDALATGTPHNGLTWSTAFLEVRDALSNSNMVNDDEIWVARGATPPAAPYAYKPTGGADRTVSFVVPPPPLLRVKLLGGFRGNAPGGGETMRTQRNPERNETVLDGDINVPGLDTDNSYNVVTIGDIATGSSIDLSTKLSGFTICNGRADGTGAHALGAGVLVTIAPAEDQDFGPALDRLLFKNNYALTGGAGLAAMGFVLTCATNCRFEHNTVAGDGGGMLVKNGYFQVQNCTFVRNAAGGNGGGLAVLRDVTSAPPLPPVLTPDNCTFFDNTRGASGVGGAVYVAPSVCPRFAVSFGNSIFWGNQAPQVAPEPPATTCVDIYQSDVQDAVWLVLAGTTSAPTRASATRPAEW